MSRGYGYVQRFVLDELDRRWACGDPWVASGELAERLEGDRPTLQTSRSVRRALLLLAADGLVELSPSADVGDGERTRARVALARLEQVALRHARRVDAQNLRRLLRFAGDQEGPPPGQTRRDS